MLTASPLRRNRLPTPLLSAQAMIVQKQVRGRIHKLTSNTLPAPIVKAIAGGDYSFVRVYQKTTVLQADMVGFTVLSSQYPPERVSQDHLHVHPPAVYTYPLYPSLHTGAALVASVPRVLGILTGIWDSHRCPH